MFLGGFKHSLDSKGRLTIPAKFRDQLASGLVVTRNPSERCLLLMPLDEWQTLSGKVRTLSIADRPSALLRRALFSNAEDLKPDRQGRILIGQGLRDFAQIDTEAMITGMDTFIEIWNPSLWDEQVLQELDSDDLNGEIFSTLGI